MKTMKLFLAIMALIAVKSYAQEIPATISSTENYAINIQTNTKVNASLNPNITIVSSTQYGGDAERSKSFSKTFSVDNGDKISLNNQYGAILIKTWDRKEVKVDVEIKAFSNSDKDVQKLIDEVSIDASKSGDQVSVRTNMSDREGNFGRKLKNGVTTWRREIKVNYVVYMPAVNALSAQQEYGSIEIGNFAGPTSFKVQYGNLIAGSLSNSNNYLYVEYGKMTIQDLNSAVVKHEYGGGVSIGSVGTIEINAEYVPVNINTIRKSADIKVQYGSGLTVGSIAGNLLLNSEYAKVNINSIKGNTVIKQGYGSLTIASVGKLSLRTEYTNVTLGTLNGDAMIDMDYNQLTVSEITPACKNFGLTGEYASVGLGFSANYNANFNLSTTYAGFKYGSNVSAKLISDEDENKRYAGKIGSGGTANVAIKTEYGAITFK
ncbi:hypothetical protein [Pedobacter mendelii]|uniref:Adhesin domain-containing protein n=1 Tax=Pedobacter mendelii TaxID=1908240 RepID=A0ABQ2BH08_9SPHI|nr:hypothetical protein [Pedobacter mendelii]GGI23173.1 hypothetical protein GCM10008119_06340 [Pedobacter mendelii]